MSRLGFFCALAVAVALSVPAAANADYSVGQGNWTRLSGSHPPNYKYFGGGGGEFTWTIPGLSNSAYDVKTRDREGRQGSFQSFCVERGEYLNSQPFDVVVSTSGPTGSRALRGGGSAGTGPGDGDPLNYSTAYLYTQFASGQLSGYGWDEEDLTNSGRSASAVDLQNAIWTLEGELSSSLSARAQGWVNDAISASAPAGSWGETIGNVRILNMWAPGHINDFETDSKGNYKWVRQDQLYLIPTPAAALMGLPLLGLLGLLRFARRKV